MAFSVSLSSHASIVPLLIKSKDQRKMVIAKRLDSVLGDIQQLQNDERCPSPSILVKPFKGLPALEPSDMSRKTKK